MTAEEDRVGEDNPYNDVELQREIDRAKTPKIKQTLLTEQANRGGPAAWGDKPVGASGGPAEWGDKPAESPKRAATPDAGTKPRPFLENAAGSILEPPMAMARGMVAGPASDIAGLGAIPLHAAGLIKTDPTAVKEKVSNIINPGPQTEGGKAAMAMNPLAILGKLLGQGAEKASQIGAPPKEQQSSTEGALRSGLREAITQAPQFAGLGGPAIAGKAGAIMKGAAEGPGKFTARGLMQSALKPGVKAMESGKSATAIDTMLDEGINVSHGGLTKLHEKIDSINDQIASAIENSTALVDKASVASRLKKTMDDFVKQVTPMSDVKTIQRAYNEFMDHPILPKITPGTPAKTVESKILDERGKPFTSEIPAVPESGTNQFPVKTAQEMKQRTYRSLKDKSYGELKSADIEAQKTLARGLKEEVALAVPEVAPLNARDSKLLTTLPLVERRVLMEANKNPAGLGILSLNPKHFALWMADRSSLFKSMVARMLNAGSDVASRSGSLGPPVGMAIGSQANQISNPPQ